MKTEQSNSRLIRLISQRFLNRSTFLITSAVAVTRKRDEWAEEEEMNESFAYDLSFFELQISTWLLHVHQNVIEWINKHS